MTPTLGIAIIAGLLLLQGFFTGSEIALVSADRASLAVRAQAGDSGATRALDLLAREDRLLSVCLLGANAAAVAAATVATYLLMSQGITRALWAVLIFAPFAVLLGDTLPKAVYRAHADALAPVLAGPLRLIELASTPLLLGMRAWTLMLETLTGSTSRPISREEIVMLLEDESGGDIDPEDRQMIRNVLSITESTAYDAMTPLLDVWGVPTDATVGQAIQVVIQSGHSRIPVFEGRIDNLVGVVSHRDLLLSPDDSAPISPITRPVRFVPESKRAGELLGDMRREHDTFAVVVDEYGGSAGVVTREDLLELLVGDIRDERDSDEPTIRQLSERDWRVPGRAEIEETNETLHYDLPVGDYDTVAGLILDKLGRIPEAGESFKIGPLRIQIEAATERAIQLVRITLPPPDPPKG